MSEHRKLHDIAYEIRREWPNPYFGAVPYINAMSRMVTVSENYGADTGVSVVLYFLSNARNWRGDSARRIKAELKAMLPKP